MLKVSSLILLLLSIVVHGADHTSAPHASIKQRPETIMMQELSREINFTIEEICFEEHQMLLHNFYDDSYESIGFVCITPEGKYKAGDMCMLTEACAVAIRGVAPQIKTDYSSMGLLNSNINPQEDLSIYDGKIYVSFQGDMLPVAYVTITQEGTYSVGCEFPPKTTWRCKACGHVNQSWHAICQNCKKRPGS